ncbi:site-specific integrase [Phycicoccus sp.]|uniref:tyrosine-type recombinase/integrase n=1 Tax=Phycicoccus sp. TaxID=1902410 RepID=UPI002B61AD15|nr:site-specific integrase [Phycicoccus sp.]HMM94003.1 site-specific integrase [Phycicoccus sp.]
MSLAVRSAPFTDRPIGRIVRSDLESWVKHMDSSGLAPGTVKTRFNNVRTVFRAALADRVIGTDPSEGVRLPRRRRGEMAMSIPTPEQVGSLLGAADERFRTFIGLCAFAGLRLGEAAAVQVADLDLVRKELRVRRQVQRVNGGSVEIRRPKYGSERVIYLAEGLTEMLDRHLELCGTHGSQGWLFAGAGGDPPHQNSVGYWWRKTQSDAGIGGLKLHDLRHFYASGLIASGCDVVTVQRSLGHASATTTLNTYAHLWPSAEDRTRKAADSILSMTEAAASWKATHSPD